MSESTLPPGSGLAEVRAAAEDLLRRVGSEELADSPLFPYGLNQVSISVRAGEIEVNVHLSGPDHGHEVDEDDDWEEMDEFFDEGEP